MSDFEFGKFREKPIVGYFNICNVLLESRWKLLEQHVFDIDTWTPAGGGTRHLLPPIDFWKSSQNSRKEGSKPNINKEHTKYLKKSFYIWLSPAPCPGKIPGCTNE
jgi:hypothetical protein